MSVRRAVVFSGQGAQRKGMGMDLINLSTAPLWENMKNTMKQNYGVNIQEIVQDNPTKVQMFEDASSLKYINSFPCSATLNENGLDKTKTTVSHKDGVLTLTYFTQPCTLAAQLLALEHYKSQKGELENVAAFAGHSLGEFTALTALEVFSPETAANLTFRRGMLMETTLDLFDRTKHRLYACNPLRAKLHSDPATCDDMFFVLVELIARALAHTTSFLEVANYNVVFEQYVAAGDPVALAVLGKCLDPQFRANSSCSSLGELVKEAISSVGVDNADGITQFPNDIKIKDFVTSSFRKYGHRATFRRFLRGPDDGFTPALSELTQLTLQEDGRSGLKRKSWFIPLPIEIPFHTSKLRRAADLFYPIVKEALPDEAELREKLSIGKDGKLIDAKQPVWITNLTGRTFEPFSENFQQDAREIMNSLNIGEISHNGRYTSTEIVDHFEQGIKLNSARDICASVLAAQMAHPVQWTDIMNEIVLKKDIANIVEFSPSRNASEMFRRTNFAKEEIPNSIISLTVSSYPTDSNI